MALSKTKHCSMQADHSASHWFLNLSVREKYQLLRSMLDLDDKYKLDYSNELVQNIQKGASAIMESLVNGIDQRDQTFKGNLVKTGDFYSRIQIRHAHELQYIYKLDPAGVFGKDHLCALENEHGEIQVCAQEKKSSNDPLYPFLSKSKKGKLGSNKKSVQLDLKSLLDRFSVLLDEAMSTCPLPLNWTHAGYKSPKYSGPRKHGPAIMFQFYYTDAKDKVYKVTVEVVLALKLKAPLNGEEEEEEIIDCRTFFKKRGYCDDICLLPSHSETRDTGYQGLHTWLGDLEENSAVKRIIRLCKVMRRLNHVNFTPDDIKPHAYMKHEQQEAKAKTFIKYLSDGTGSGNDKASKEQATFPSTVEMNVYSSFLKKSNIFSKYDEIVPRYQCITSLDIQKAVLMLFVTSWSKCPEGTMLHDVWKLEDIPSIVISTLEILKMDVTYQRKIPRKSSLRCDLIMGGVSCSFEFSVDTSLLKKQFYLKVIESMMQSVQKLVPISQECQDIDVVDGSEKRADDFSLLDSLLEAYQRVTVCYNCLPLQQIETMRF